MTASATASAVLASLQAYGDRVQLSVFIAAAGEDMLRQARDWIGLIINLQEGSAASSVNVRHAGKRPVSTARRQ